MKKYLGILFALVLALSLTLVPGVASADVSPVLLSTSGAGTAEWVTTPVHAGGYSLHLTAPGKCDWSTPETYEATYADALVQMPLKGTPLEGTTLSGITSMSWWNQLVSGYPPALRIKLDCDADGISDYHLVAEFAYQEWLGTTYIYQAPWDPYTHYKPGLEGGDTFYYPTYDDWMQTFHTTQLDPESARPVDTVATQTVGANTIFWTFVVGGVYGTDWCSCPINSPPGEASYFATLNDYKTTTVSNIKGDKTLPILGGAEVLMLEFAITNEIGSDVAPPGHDVYIDDLMINDVSWDFEAPSSVVSMTASSPAVIGISVTPLSVNFGSLIPGIPSVPQTVTVTNTGNVPENFTAEIFDDLTGVYADGLKIDDVAVSDWNALNVGVGHPAVPSPSLVLTVPTGTAPGTYEATLVFWAIAH